MMSEAIIEDFKLRRIITEVTMTHEVHTQSLNTQETCLISPSVYTSSTKYETLSQTLLFSLGDMWKTELDDLDDMMECWTPIAFQDTSKSGNVYVMLVMKEKYMQGLNMNCNG